ncbi:hypothetical protein [Mesorhizobium sp. M1121]
MNEEEISGWMRLRFAMPSAKVGNVAVEIKHRRINFLPVIGS